MHSLGSISAIAIFPIGSNVKLSPAVAAILIGTKNVKFVEDHPMIMMHSLGSISAIASEKKIFLYFPIWSCVNTMTCGGSHLEWFKRSHPMFGSAKKTQTFLGSLVSIVQWFKRSVLNHFSHRVQC